MKKNKCGPSLLLPGIFFSCILLFSCGKKVAEALPEFDFSAGYPEKEIDLSRYFDTRYISVATDTVMLPHINIVYASREEYVGYEFTKQTIVFLNGKGDIVRRIDKNGNGRGEYQEINSVCYDPGTGELFILDIDKQLILVMDKEGSFLRDFPAEIGGREMDIMRNFDRNHLISYNYSGDDKKGGTAYHLIDKRDGRAVKTWEMSLIPDRIPAIIYREGNSLTIYTFMENRMIDAGDYFLLNESSCDTIYKLTKSNCRLEPFLVKSPSLAAMNPSRLSFLYITLDIPELLVFTVRKMRENAQGRPEFEKEFYFYDKNLKKIFKAAGKHESYAEAFDCGVFEECETPYGIYINDLEVPELLEKDGKGLVKGTLKNVASRLQEEDNPVLEILTLKTKKR